MAADAGLEIMMLMTGCKFSSADAVERQTNIDEDSYLTDTEEEGYRYCLLGEGDVPVPDALQVLRAGGYDGYLTLEWEKAWKDYLPDPAVGFPQYVRKLRHYLAQLG